LAKLPQHRVTESVKNQQRALWMWMLTIPCCSSGADCGHCKKAAPFMVEFAEKFKDKGVKVFAVCTSVAKSADDKDVPDCWKGVEEKGLRIFIY